MPGFVTTLADHRSSRARVAVAQQVWAGPTTSYERPVDDGALTSSGLLLHFEQNHEIYAEGEETGAFYKVARGVVRTCKFLDDGRRQIDAFYLPGEVFGVELGSEHRLSAEAVSDCAIMASRRCGGEAFFETDGPMARQFLTHVLRSLHRAQQHAQLLCHRSAAQKMAGFLLDMAERAPNEGNINLPMSRQDIADYLGLTIETVSRTLSQLERENVIELRNARQIVLVNRGKLRRLDS